MRNIKVAPALLQVLRHQTPVAVMGFVFAAEEAALCDDFFWDPFLNPAFAHKVEEAHLVRVPIPLELFVLIQHLLSWCEVGEMYVIHAADLFEKEGKVISLGKPCKLGNVVEANIHNPFCASLPQSVEEL